MTYDNTAYKDNKNNTDKLDLWRQQKRGKFSASMSFKLMSKGKSGEMFGDGAWTYIKTTALEMVTKVWDNESSKGDQIEPMLHGKVHEYPAFVHYVQETKNFKTRYFGDETPLFIPYPKAPEEFGCSPDGGYFIEDGISTGVEIKCPYDSMYHFQRLKWKDQWDILKEYPACYAQIQTSLMCTGADVWDFVSYDERQIMKKYRIKIIPVLPDINYQNNMEVRIKQAIKEKYRILSEYLGMEIKDRADFQAKIQYFL